MPETKVISVSRFRSAVKARPGSTVLYYCVPDVVGDPFVDRFEDMLGSSVHEGAGVCSCSVLLQLWGKIEAMMRTAGASVRRFTAWTRRSYILRRMNHHSFRRNRWRVATNELPGWMASSWSNYPRPLRPNKGSNPAQLGLAALPLPFLSIPLRLGRKELCRPRAVPPLLLLGRSANPLTVNNANFIQFSYWSILIRCYYLRLYNRALKCFKYL